MKKPRMILKYLDPKTLKEKKYILATLDPITGLAEANEDVLVKLLKDVELDIPDAGDILALVSEDLGVDLDKKAMKMGPRSTRRLRQ
jgi:hypothetical protein